MDSLPMPLYQTAHGEAYVGDALALLRSLDDDSVDLVLTSPPFALQREKEYGNKDQDNYVDWLLNFTSEVRRVIKDEGSFVIDLGGAYRKGRPVRSLYNYRLLIRLCDEQDFRLAEEFFWYNPSKLPSPIEWVNKRKIRAKDAVNTVWWLSKTDFPKADVRNVLKPYSERMKQLLKKGDDYYSPKKRPSGHDISDRFREDKGGAIPPNLLEIPNTESNSQYLRLCREIGLKRHPARFPQDLPEFFIKFLTDRDDLVIDIFAGSNTTGAAAEKLGRKWMAFEKRRNYVVGSALRFLGEGGEHMAESVYEELKDETRDEPVQLPQVRQLRLGESQA
ncbi:MAG: site-specific DNA-methyltransferase [Armatimonadota bacterium]|nr:site-specific DNA-methyltransferase [Armatimonadota bacterium]